MSHDMTHPWAVFWTTFDTNNAFEDTHSHEISRRQHKLYMTVFIKLLNFSFLVSHLQASKRLLL